jgi:hypothetical protein
MSVMPADSINGKKDHNSRWCLVALAAILGCHRSASEIRTKAVVTEPETRVSNPSPPTTPDGRPLSGVERVDADTIRVKTLVALGVEANEIDCPHVVRSASAPVPKDVGPWQLEGDLVETDFLLAHTVSARLIVADEIQARTVTKVAQPHLWAGAGGPAPIRNRVRLAPGFQAPSANAPDL